MSRVELYREQGSQVEPRPDGTLKFVPHKWRWRFISNGHIMADSGQGYVRRIDALNGCATVLGGAVVGGRISRDDRLVPVVYDLTRRP